MLPGGVLTKLRWSTGRDVGLADRGEASKRSGDIRGNCTFGFRGVIRSPRLCPRRPRATLAGSLVSSHAELAIEP